MLMKSGWRYQPITMGRAEKLCLRAVQRWGQVTNVTETTPSDRYDL